MLTNLRAHFTPSGPEFLIMVCRDILLGNLLFKVLFLVLSLLNGLELLGLGVEGQF